MIGEKLGPFVINEKLGAGAMGVVYRATWEPSGQAVAVKVIHQEHATKANAAERFDRESDILKQFRHPNIVRHIGVGFSRARKLRYYAMEYVPGTTLEHVLDGRGALPWPEVVTLGIQIAEALEYAKQRGIVHRDLKPSNLMITRQGQVKLTDFGIAKDLDRTALTADGRTLGTAAYMAPEQIRGTPEVSHKTDLYALGCLFYQMLTGSTPFEGKSAVVLMHKHLDEPPPRPSARNPQIPLALDKLVVQLMAKDRDERPWDAQVVSDVLTDLRDKKARNEPIPMVFGDEAANPTRLGATGTAAESPSGATAAPPTGTATRPRKGRKARRSATGTVEEGATLRSRLEVAGLIAGLILVSGLIAYAVWPPSAKYLHQEAGRLMASDRRADWIYARERYLDPLDRRFPDHPYQDEVRGWRDRILLGDADRRARVLESPGLTGTPEPRNPGEAEFLRTLAANRDDEEQGYLEVAAVRWEEMASRLDPEDPEERAWHLLALRRAGDVRERLERRRRDVQALLNEAIAAYDIGRFDRAAELYARIVRDYERFPYLVDLVAVAMAHRENVTIAPPPPDPASPPGAGVAGFENTPEGAVRAHSYARLSGDISALRRATTEASDATLARLLAGVRRVPPRQLDELRRHILATVRVRPLAPGEEVTLPDGTTHVVAPGDVTEERALVALLDPMGQPTSLIRLRLHDGLWRVEPGSALPPGGTPAEAPGREPDPEAAAEPPPEDPAAPGDAAKASPPEA